MRTINSLDEKAQSSGLTSDENSAEKSSSIDFRLYFNYHALLSAGLV